MFGRFSPGTICQDCDFWPPAAIFWRAPGATCVSFSEQRVACPPSDLHQTQPSLHRVLLFSDACFRARLREPVLSKKRNACRAKFRIYFGFNSDLFLLISVYFCLFRSISVYFCLFRFVSAYFVLISSLFRP